MKSKNEQIICHVKSIRQNKGLSQQQLAGLVKVKRQAIYDIESGKYMPNTVLALRLAKHLGCKVEDLFSEVEQKATQPITLPEGRERTNTRIMAAKVRNRLVGYPLSGNGTFSEGFGAADGLITNDGNTASLFCSEICLDRTIMLLGCDPAFAVLAGHVSHIAPDFRLHCRFASSQMALQGLASGFAHMAGTHLHNRQAGEENVQLARTLLGSSSFTLIAFSMMEEGLMVAPGNPKGIRSAAELTEKRVKFVNREPGAALRTLLDDHLNRLHIPQTSVKGYEDTVASHLEGARMVAFGFADAALGLRAVADFHCLDFVPMATVRCDLVVPKDLLVHPAINIVLDVLQGRKLRQELAAIPGYEASLTGTIIAET